MCLKLTQIYFWSAISKIKKTTLPQQNGSWNAKSNISLMFGYGWIIISGACVYAHACLRLKACAYHSAS